jgi:hypothetical protein
MFVLRGPRNAPFPMFPNVPMAGRLNNAVLSQGTQVAEPPQSARELAGAV